MVYGDFFCIFATFFGGKMCGVCHFFGGKMCIKYV